MLKVKSFMLFILLLSSGLLLGSSVDQATARKAATNWYQHYASASKQLGTISKVKEYKWRDRTSFYICSFDKGGFVIISANDQVTPVLGYGFEHAVPDEITNEAVKGWFDNYARQIDTTFVLNLKSEEASSKWEAVLENNFPKLPGDTVGPLLTTTWNQVYPYNILCPENPQGSGNYMPGGCTPIAVAQIMKYWNYPNIGIGYHEYAWNDQSISAYFNEQPYNITSMPDYLTQPDSAVALLLFHAGVASSVDYQPDGSGAYLSEARNGLVNYFDYKSSAEYIFRWAPAVSDSIWIQMLKEDLDSLSPIIYEGYGGIGHAWVCDGYNENNFFHMNWGWGGNLNGYFQINNLTPGGININGFQGAVFNIEPAYSELTANFTTSNGIADYQKQFTDFTKGDPDDRLWDFGDGDNSIEINPLHQYDSAGLYLVTLIVSKNGIVDTIQKNVRVTFPYFTDINLTVVPGVEDFSSFDLGDYDNDGDLDILIQYLGYVNGVRNYYNRLYKNEELSGFTCVDAGFPDVYGGSANWSDFQNNNNLACSVTGFDMELNPYGAIFRNLDGAFEFDQTFSEHTTYSDAAWGDLNNDGDIDLALIEYNGNEIVQYKNLKNNLVFDTSYEITDWVMDLRMDICDINADGINEIPFYSKTGDFDNDGDLDGFQRGWFYYQNGEIVSYQNGEIFVNQDGTMTSYYQIFPYGVDWGDFDGDGDYDVLSANTVYRNDEGVFVDLELGLTDAITWFDYDNDNDLDIVFSQQGSAYSNWKILRNNINPAAISPTIPTNITTVPIGNQVTFNWTRTEPLPESGAGYTYNLFVGKTDSTCEVFSPMANIETGHRKILACGNASADTTWSLNSLTNGIYYYGIQSINAQYRGSGFITGTFTINGANLPAELIPIEKQGYVHLPLAFSKKEFSDCFIDPEDDSLYLIKIVSLPQFGDLFLNGIQISINTIVDSASIQFMTYQTDTIANDQFLWTASNSDGTIYTENPASASIIVYPLQEQLEYNFSSMAASLGDYDNDLDLDLLTGNVLIKNNEGSFNDTVYTLPVVFRSSHFVDYDSDGLLDLLIANDDVGLLFYRNLGNDIFEEESVNIISMATPRYAIGDYNCDGYIDIILSGVINNSGPISEAYSTILYTNDKTGNFITSDIDFPPVRVGMFCFGDINNDGYPDLVMAGETDWDGTRILRTYFNDGNGGFIQSNQELTGLSYGSLELNDVDLDGDLDLLTCGRYKYIYSGTYSSQTTLYINTNGNFQLLPGLPLSNINSGEARFVDINQNGKLDIMLTGQEYNYGQGGRFVSKLYLNRYPDFIEVENNLPESYASSLEFGDIDNDGDQDVILSGVNPETSNFQTKIFKNTYGNNTYTENFYPSLTENLQVYANYPGINFFWNKSTDNSTPQNALSYNIFVSQHPDSLFIVSPMADTETGFRKIVQSGNTSLNNFWHIDSLPLGTYYWSVQAIDNSFAGGPFAPVDSFTVVNVINQEVTLSAGWNIASFYIHPYQLATDSIFSPLMASGNLVKTINESGGFIQNIPGIGWMNTIGDMENTEGYYIKMDTNDTLTIIGAKVNLPFEIPLQTGWNIMGYPMQSAQSAMNALQPLITEGSLIKVVDESGGLIQNVPGVGWMNTIGNFEPGEGYYIKVNTNTGLTFVSSTSWQCGDTIVDPRDGQSYNTVSIGDQCWMAENLNVGTRIDGANEQADNSTIEKYCYDDNEANCDVYGGLYQWDQMMQYVTTEGEQGICPVGWHLPSDNEWKTLEMMLGMSQSEADNIGWRGTDEGGKMKETGTTHWNSPNTGATNSSGFTVLPGGFRYTDGSFDGLGYSGHGWSSSEGSDTDAWRRALNEDIAQVNRYSGSKTNGFSVRCLKNASTQNQPPNEPGSALPENNAQNQLNDVDLSWSCSDPDGDPLTYDVYFGTSTNPSLVSSAIEETTYDPGILNFETAYYWKIVAHDDHGNSSEGDIWQFSTGTQNPNWQCGDPLEDARDGQSYNTAAIGDQCWMAENLNVGARIDGASEQADNSTIEKYCYEDDVANCEVYGGLYQWDEMMQYVTSESAQGICPDGWHVPSDNEWKTLEMELGMSQAQADGGGIRGTDQGTQMKSTTGWDNDGNGSNTSGFTALPSGLSFSGGIFFELGNHGNWYTSNEESSSESWSRNLQANKTTVVRWHYSKAKGYSVRCLKD